MAHRQTGPERAADRFVRGTFFVCGVMVTPAALYGVVGQRQVAALVAVVCGLGLLGAWWLLRPRLLTPDARRWQSACGGLSLVVTAAVALTIVQFLRTSPDDVSPATLTPTIITGAVAIVLLAARVAAGRRLRALVARDAAAEPREAPPSETTHRRLAVERNIRDVGRRVRSGGYPSSASLTIGSDGVATLRPDPHRLHPQYSLIGLPFALILSVRLVLAFGWIGLAIIAGTIGFGLALALVIHRLQVWHGFARLTATTLSVRPWYGRLRSVPRSQIARVALVHANLGTAMGRDYYVDLMLFLDRDGRCVLHTNTMGVTASDQQAFAAVVDVPIEVLPDAPGPEDLRRQYPGSVSWYWSHQVAVAITASFVLVILVIGGVIGVAAITGQFATPTPAHLGQTRSLADVADVTVLAVDDPAQIKPVASLEQPGTRLVGVDVRIHNAGSASLFRPSLTVEVIDSTQHVDDSIGTATSPGEADTDVDIPPGKTVTAYVVARVPEGASVAKVEYQYLTPRNSSLETLDWILPAPRSTAASSAR